IADDVEAEHLRPTAIRDDQRRQDAEQRRLAAAVRPDESEELAGIDRERHVGERLGAIEAFLDRLGHDRSRRCRAAHCAVRVAANWTSTGMPIFRTFCPFGTRILIAYTRSARSSRV